MVFKKKTYRKKAYNGKADLALKKVNHLERVLKPEVKQRFTLLAANPVDSSFTAYSALHDVAQGLSINQRIGNDILVKRIRIRSYVQLANSVAGQMVAFRALVIRYKQQTPGVNPPAGLVLSSAIGAFMDPTTQQYHQASLNTVEILYDKNFSMSMSSKPSMFINVDIKKDIPVKYNGVLGSNIQKNGLYYYLISDVAPAGANPLADSWFLTDYTDV